MKNFSNRQDNAESEINLAKEISEMNESQGTLIIRKTE